MASKISGHTTYVAIAPYRVEGSAGEEFNELSVTTNYDSRRKHFYVALHAGWTTQWGGHGCIIMGDQNPLTAPQYIAVKDAPRNSQKTIDEMGAALELAREDIAYLWDKREWALLQNLVKSVALHGYTEDIKANAKMVREAIEEKENQDNNQSTNNQNQTVMATIEMNNETKNAAQQQVNNEVESVAVGEVTLASILPAMQPVEGSEYQVKDGEGRDVTFVSTAPTIEPDKAPEPEAKAEQPAVTMPLGDHGTLVIGGCGLGEKKPTATEEKPKVTLKRKQPQPDPEAVGELAGGLTRVMLVTYQTKRGETAPRIIGFSGEDDPRYKPILDEKQAQVAAYNKAKKKDPKAKMTSSPFGPAWLTDREGTGEKTWCMTLGVRYMDVARQLCEAYNTTDRNRWQQAEQAVRDLKNGIVADYQTQKAARQAEREAKRAAKKGATTAAAQQPAVQTGYTDEQVAAMLRQIMAGGEIPTGIKEAMAKAA